MIPSEKENIIDESVKEELSAETLESIYQNLTHAANLENPTKTKETEDNHPKGKSEDDPEEND